MIVSQDDAASAAALPGRSLVYMNGTDVNTQWSAGVPYSQALANGWLLRDASGNLLTSTQYGSYVADVGNSAYQQAWIANTLAFLAAYPGLKGVFIDQVLNDIAPTTGAYPAEYPTQGAWAAAMASFISAVGPALQAHGYYVLVNAVGYIAGDSDSLDGTADVAWWQQLGPSVSGLMNEYYDQVSDGSNTLRASGTAYWTQYWDGWQRLISTAQNMGKDFVGVTYGAPGDTQTMTYAKASFLQQWNGGNSTLIFNPTDNSDPWNSAWTTDIGQPAATSQQVGTGWMRQYTNGIALVNPDPNNPQTFQLPGSYLTPNGTTVTTVTLQPTTGMILQGTTTLAAQAATVTPATPDSDAIAPITATPVTPAPLTTTPVTTTPITTTPVTTNSLTTAPVTTTPASASSSAYVQSDGADSGTTNRPTVNLSGVTAGDWLIVAVATDSNAATKATVSDNAGNSYTLRGSRYDAQPGAHDSVAYFTAPVTTGDSLTITAALGSSVSSAMQVMEVVGGGIDQVVITKPVLRGNTASNGETSTAKTTSQNGETIVGLITSTTGADSYDPGTGYTSRESLVTSNNTTMAMETMAKTTAGSTAATWTSTGWSAPYIAAMITIKPSTTG